MGMFHEAAIQRGLHKDHRGFVEVHIHILLFSYGYGVAPQDLLGLPEFPSTEGLHKVQPHEIEGGPLTKNCFCQ